MLTGKITYNFNGKIYKYKVTGIDTSTVLSLTLTSGSEDAIRMMTEDNSETNISERRLDIKLSNIVVQTDTYVDSATGKNKKKPVNSDMFCRLGALIRYAKINCIKTNEVGYTGLGLASKEFEALPERDYVK